MTNIGNNKKKTQNILGQNQTLNHFIIVFKELNKINYKNI